MGNEHTIVFCDCAADVDHISRKVIIVTTNKQVDILLYGIGAVQVDLIIWTATRQGLTGIRS